MLILAFDTSALAGSVALLRDEVVLTNQALDPDRRSAQSLAPAIDELLRRMGVTPADIGLVATTLGPGSFTGLRVGATTAKTLAYALGCDVIGLDTLDVIAAQLLPSPLAGEGPGVRGSGGTAFELHAVLDAQRKELFLARYQRGDDLDRMDENRIVTNDDWLAGLASGTIVTGPGLSKLRERLPPDVVIADSALWEPQAVTVAQLALAEHRRGRRDDLWKLAPAYLRASAAEEKAKSTK